MLREQHRQVPAPFYKGRSGRVTVASFSASPSRAGSATSHARDRGGLGHARAAALTVETMPSCSSSAVTALNNDDAEKQILRERAERGQRRPGPGTAMSHRPVARRRKLSEVNSAHDTRRVRILCLLICTRLASGFRGSEQSWPETRSARSPVHPEPASNRRVSRAATDACAQGRSYAWARPSSNGRAHARR